MERFLASDVGKGGGSANDRCWEAFGWGLLSASSLVIGACVGIARLPSKVSRAALMAFGGGALIEALSIELFAHLLATARGGHGHSDGEVDRVLVFLALGGALSGGLIFAGLDRALSNHGAFLRKAATVQAQMGRLRYALTRRLLRKLRQVPMFEVLSERELHRLARSMIKERYRAGATIFAELNRNSSVFFLLSGKVELKLTTRYGAASDRSAASGVTHPGLTDDIQVVDRFLLWPNDIFGEMALFSSETMQAQAVALANSCVLRIPNEAIHHMLASNRRMQDFVAMIAIDRLRETAVFCRCTPSTVARLVSFTTQAEFEAGDVMFNDIDGLCPIYFVVLGCVEVTYGSARCSHHQSSDARRVVKANELLGTEHLVTGQALHAKAVALERTTVLIVKRNDIDKLCEHDERFRQALLSSGKAGARLSAHMSDKSVAHIGALGLDQVELTPVEGVDAPAKFGYLAEGDFAELGWKKQASPPAPCETADWLEDDIVLDVDTVLEERRDNHGILKEAKAPQVCKHSAPPRSPINSPPASPKLPSSRPSRGLDECDLFDDSEVLDTQDLPDLLESAAYAAAKKCDDGGAHGHGRGAQAAIMIWLGILIDSVPESVVMGILVNTATRSTLLTFVCGVFLANFPEAMSSAGTMYAHGMRKYTVLMMWASITITTGLGAYVGALLFPPGSKEDPVVAKVIGCIEGLCGGAMLCMIANTVLPEAFEQGGNVTGLSTLMGFVMAIVVSVIA